MPEEKFNVNKLKELTQDPLGIGIIALSAIALISLSLTSIALIIKGSNETSKPNDIPIETNNEPIKNEPQIPGKLGNKVWIDTNRNGIQDTDEVGLPETIVYLIDINTNVIQANSTTNNLGEYIFENINPGNYEIQVAIPEIYTASPFQAGENRETDNDFTLEEQSTFGIGRVIKSSSIVLKNGEEQMGIDAGLQVFEEIKGIVWQDINNDKVYDAKDRGIQGIVVSLLDQDGNIIDSRISEQDGIYKFISIKPGKYSIKYESNQNFSTQNPSSNNVTLEQLTTTPTYTEPITIDTEQKISNINQMFYELTPEIKAQLQIVVTPTPQATEILITPATENPTVTTTPDPTIIPADQPTPTVTTTPVSTPTPTPNPTQDLTPLVTIETMDEGTGSGSQIVSPTPTPTISSGNNSNLVQTGLPIFILGILGGINLIMLKFTNADKSDNQVRRRRIKRYTMR